MDHIEKTQQELLKLFSAVESSGEAIFITDREGIITYINPEFTRLYGFTSAEVIGKATPRILKSGLLAPENYQYFWSNLLKKEVVRGELINKTKEGRLITVQGSANPILDDQGEIIGFIGIQHDISEHKKAEEHFSLLANALKGITECVSITDMNDRVIFLNQAFLDTYGFSKDDLEEESISFIRSPNNPAEIVDEILPATIKGGWKGEIWNRRKDGSEFLVALSTSAVKNDKGEPIALIGVASDITFRKRTELENQVNYDITEGITATSNLDELLKLIHQSLGRVVYAENCIVALHNPKTGLFSFPYWVDKFDPTPEPGSLGKSCTDYVFRNVKPLLLSQKIFDQLVAQNEVELIGSNSPSWIGIPLQTPSRVIGVLVLQHYEKENVYSEGDVRFLTSIGNQVAFAIERKISDEEILLKNQLLQGLNAEKDKFFSIIAHDLRGPLSAFVAATQIITEEIQTMSAEDIREITLSMKDSATGIYSLLENLLEWSRLRRGGMDFVPEKINLSKKTGECISILSESARKKKIGIDVSIPKDIEILADNHMFDTVIRNLVSNAIKFTPAGGKINVEAGYTNDNLVEIKVKDSGIGMTKDLLNKLFQISEKTSRKGTDGEASTGLGLLLVKEFIEKHGGTIWVESEVGKGSTFSFTLRNLKT